MKLIRTALVIALLPWAAYAAKPAVPTYTVGAGLKQLQIDVNPVPGATYYQLWFLANGNATWVKYMDTTDADPLFKVTVSAHLLDWFNARYRVAACNAEGCTSTVKFAVTEHMKETPGYLKTPAAAVAPFAYGQSPALSADGKTLAVIGGETIGTRQRSVRVNVYQKDDSGWRLTARLRPSAPVEAGTADQIENYPSYPGTPRTLAISADGTTLVLGVPREFILTPNSGVGQGAVYVFRKSGSTWTEEQKIGPGTKDHNWLGAKVSVDATGQLLMVWKWYPDTGGDYWYLDIYRHDASGWTRFKQLPETSRGYNIDNFALSGDGKVLVLSYYDNTIAVHTAPNFALTQTLTRITAIRRATGLGINYDGSVIATETSPHDAPAGATWQTNIMAFRRGSSGWVAEPAFTYLSKQPKLKVGFSDEFASSIAVSKDGKFIAVGDPLNRYVGTGALHTPVTSGDVQSGAVFVFERKPTSWELRSLIKPNVAYEGTRFGAQVAFGDNQRILAVGATGDASAARDIDGNQADTTAPDSGALWLY
jgi:hypothetical protein